MIYILFACTNILTTAADPVMMAKELVIVLFSIDRLLQSNRGNMMFAVEYRMRAYSLEFREYKYL